MRSNVLPNVWEWLKVLRVWLAGIGKSLDPNQCAAQLTATTEMHIPLKT